MEEASRLHTCPLERRSTLSEEQKQDVRDAFDMFDQDEDCALNTLELKAAMATLNFHVDTQKAEKIIEKYDKYNTGLISYPDFMDLMTRWILQKDPREDLRRIFTMIDDDASGTIDIRKLRRINCVSGAHLTENDLRDMIRISDSNSDGLVSQENFFAIMDNKFGDRS